MFFNHDRINYGLKNSRRDGPSLFLLFDFETFFFLFLRKKKIWKYRLSTATSPKSVHLFYSRYTEGKSILIEETGSCRVPIPVARCPFSASLLEVEQHVLSQVILHWSIGARTGKASFSGLPFNIDKLDLVKLSPVSWGKYTETHINISDVELKPIVGVVAV
jgi:hypothetical protein